MGVHVSALLVDFDETIADCAAERVEAVQAALLKHLGVAPDPAVVNQALLRRANLEQQMELLAAALLRIEGSAAMPSPDLVRRLVRAFRERYYGERQTPVCLYPGVEAALRAVAARHVPLVLVTSRYKDHEEDGLRWGVLRELDRAGLGGLFTAVVGYEDTVDHKPHPAPYRYGLEVLGLPAEGAIALGDSPLDVYSARGAGLRVAGALWGAISPDDLLAAKPDWALRHPEELLHLL